MTTAKQILQDALMYRGPRGAITSRSRVGDNWRMGDLMRAVAMNKATKDVNAATRRQECGAYIRGMKGGSAGRDNHGKGEMVAVSTDMSTPNGSGESTGPASTGPETPNMFTGPGLPGVHVLTEGVSAWGPVSSLAETLQAHQASLLEILNRPVIQGEYMNLVGNTADCFCFAGFSPSYDEVRGIISKKNLDTMVQDARRFSSDLNPDEDLLLDRNWREEESFQVPSVIGAKKPIPMVAPQPKRIINIAHIASSLDALLNGTGYALGERRQVSAPAGEVEGDEVKFYSVEIGNMASTSNDHGYCRGLGEYGRGMHEIGDPESAPA